MGHCRYLFNPTELYQRTTPGTAPETTCGARTWPAVDEPEIVAVRMPNPSGSAEAVYAYQKTGRMLPRATDDPFCPMHGGSDEPAPPPVTIDQLAAAHEAYLQLVDRFERDKAAAETKAIVGVPMPAPPPEVRPPAAVTADDVEALRQQLLDLASRAQAENQQGAVSDGQ